MPRGLPLGILLANDASRSSDFRLDQLAAHPELQQPVFHQDVAGAAGVSLTHVHLLVSDTNDAVAGHLPRNPVVAVPFRLADLCVARLEAARGRAIVTRPMGSLGV